MLPERSLFHCIPFKFEVLWPPPSTHTIVRHERRLKISFDIDNFVLYLFLCRSRDMMGNSAQHSSISKRQVPVETLVDLFHRMILTQDRF